MIFPKRNRFIELLDKNGWQIIETQKKDNHWILEIWLIKSDWSPTDCRAFLTFEIDKESTAGQSRAVSYVRTGLKRPVGWLTDNREELEQELDSERDGFSLFFGGGWEKRLPGFFQELSELRTKFENLKKR